jgi:hypothetical protein
MTHQTQPENLHAAGLGRAAAARPGRSTETGGQWCVMNFTKKIGVILLGIWLIVHGLMVILHLSFQGSAVIMAILAIVAGILLLIDR